MTKALFIGWGIVGLVSLALDIYIRYQKRRLAYWNAQYEQEQDLERRAHVAAALHIPQQMIFAPGVLNTVEFTTYDIRHLPNFN